VITQHSRNEGKNKNLQEVLGMQDCLRSTHANGIVNNGGKKIKPMKSSCVYRWIVYRCTWHTEAEGKIDGLSKTTRMFEWNSHEGKIAETFRKHQWHSEG